MPVACSAFNRAVQALEEGLDGAIDGGEFDVREHWPTLVSGQGSMDRLAATLKLRKHALKTALMANGSNGSDSMYSNASIGSVFDRHGGIAGYRDRCSKSKQRADQVRGKKVMGHMTAESLAWVACPVLCTTMKTPQILPCGHTFDKKTIDSISRSRERPITGVCPTCRKRFKKLHVVRNYALQEAIEWYKSLPAVCKSGIEF